MGYNDAAIVVLHRWGTENKDLKTNNADGHSDADDTELDLQDNEIALIKHAKTYFDKVIVIINSSNTMSLGELAEPKTDGNLGVDGILWVGGVGQVGTYAAGTILSGETNPSGRTVDTWWTDVKKDPSFTNVSDMTQNKDASGNRGSAFFTENGKDTVFATVEYREDIYMGYRYTETGYADMEAAEAGSGESWYADTVAYPFGYGLSYTDFKWQLAGISKSRTISSATQTITMKIKVTNTGRVAGKDVVEVYYSAPYTAGGIEKAAVNLAGFAKTKLLQPGKSEIVTVQFVAQDMASFDWNDANGNGFAGYELEAGEYVISARNSAHGDVISEKFDIAETIKCTTDYTTGNEITPVFATDGDYTTVRDSLLNNLLSRADGMSRPAAETAEELELADWEAATLYAQETYTPVNDEAGQPWYTSSVPSTWTQGAASDVTQSDLSGVKYIENKIVDGKVEATADDEGTGLWEEYMNSLSWDKLVAVVANTDEVNYSGSDGPVQFSGGTCWSTSPVSAATWNVELLAEQGEMYGTEAIFAGKTGWHGGGLNTHRSPFNGRNFEYYSEDGVLAGIMGAAVVKGVTSKGVVSYYKHFFGNDQEYKRAEYGGVATFATEQAFREIYMKPFEYIVKAGTNGLMTSFNRVGYIVNSNNWAVHETLLRDEWGFTGATITDMWAKNYVSLDLMARAGDDIVLGGSESFTDTYFSDSRWNAAANCAEVEDEDGNWVLSPTEYYAIRKSAQRVLYAYVNSNAMKNNATDMKITADLYYGLDNSALIVCEDTNDLTISLADGETLPAGITIDGSVISYAAIDSTYVAEGEYTVKVNVSCDNWVTTSATLTIRVNSPISLDGSDINGGNTAEDPLVTLKTGTAYEATFGTNYYTDHKVISNRMYVNWYYSTAHGNFNRDEDKSAADIVTHPADEAEVKHEFGYTYEGNLPEGMTLEEVTGLVTGVGGGQYECVIGYKLSGTPTTAGTYTFTVMLNVPYVTCFNNWLFTSFGAGDMKISKTVTVVVE